MDVEHDDGRIFGQRFQNERAFLLAVRIRDLSYGKVTVATKALAIFSARIASEALLQFADCDNSDF